MNRDLRYLLRKHVREAIQQLQESTEWQECSNLTAGDFLITRFLKYLCLPEVFNETAVAHYAA